MLNSPEPVNRPPDLAAHSDVPAGKAGSAAGAVMLSLFAYPGSGHLLFKAKARGAIWASLFTVSLALCFGTFFYKLSALYNGATSAGSLQGFDISGWVPVLVLVLVTGALWVLPALDVLWLALRSHPADANLPTQVEV